MQGRGSGARLSLREMPRVIAQFLFQSPPERLGALRYPPRPIESDHWEPTLDSHSFTPRRRRHGAGRTEPRSPAVATTTAAATIATRKRSSTRSSTTRSRMTSGVLDLVADVSAGDQGEFRLQPQRPVPGRRGRPDGAPAARLDRVRHRRGRGPEHRLRGRAVVTEDNAFVEYGRARPTRSAPRRSRKFQEQAEAQAADERRRTPTRRRRSSRAASRRSRRRAAIPPPATSTSAPGSPTSPTRAPRTSTATEAVHVCGDVDVDAVARRLRRPRAVGSQRRSRSTPPRSTGGGRDLRGQLRHLQRHR